MFAKKTRNTIDSFAASRARMVKEQLVSRGIFDQRVLSVMASVPRHLFVSDDMQAEAYDDHPLEIGREQTISQPYMVALICECLALKGTEKVLEIGTGSGYQSAVLAELACEVHTVERHRSLAVSAVERFNEQLLPVTVHIGDGSLGWPENGLYDGIAVTAASPRIPNELLDQLALGGRLVIPVGSRSKQRLQVATKSEDGIDIVAHGGCKFVPLIGAAGWDR